MFQTLDALLVRTTAKQFIFSAGHLRYEKIDSKKINFDVLLKSQLKRLKIVNWYNLIRIRAGLTTAHSLQRKFEPHTFVRRPGELTFNSNKWRNYRDGKHKPNQDLIKEVEIRIPGSALEVDHPLWVVLDVSRNLDFCFNELLMKLGPRIQNAIFDMSQQSPNYLLRKRSNKQIANAISKIADLNSLAALTILMREAIDWHKQSDANFWAKETYNMLLMLGLELHQRNIAIPIIDLYRSIFFDFAGYDGLAFRDTIQDIVFASASLAILVFQFPENQNASLSWEKRAKYMRKLLKNEKQDDFLFALNPLFEPVYKVSKNRKLQCAFMKSKRLESRRKIAQILQLNPSNDSGSPFSSSEMPDSLPKATGIAQHQNVNAIGILNMDALFQSLCGGSIFK